MMSCVSHPPMWTSTPCRQYPPAPILAPCECYQNRASLITRQSNDQFCSPSSSLSIGCNQKQQQQWKHVQDILPTAVSSTHLQVPSNPLCTCFQDDMGRQKLDSTTKCICSPLRQVQNGNTGVYNGSPPFSVPFTPQSAYLGSDHRKMLHTEALQCRKVLLMDSKNHDQDCTPHLQSHRVVDSQSRCSCFNRFTLVCNCSSKHIDGPLPYQNCTCDKGVREEACPIRNNKDHVSFASCDSNELESKCADLSKEPSTYSNVEGMNVLKWQHQHMQQLAVQRSEVSCFFFVLF